jgi:hypothetical protein
MRPRDAAVRFVATGLAFLLAAQAEAQSPAPIDSMPRLTIRRGEGLVGLLRNSDVRVAVDRDAYVAMFAIAPGTSAAPIQVLAPREPQETSLLRAGKSYPVRPLSGRALMHLAEADRPPLLVAFVSLVRPNLGAFREGTRWSTELVVSDSTLRDTPALLKALAHELYGDVPYREVFGTDVPYRVVTERATEAVHVTPTASAGFESDCLTKFATLSYTGAVTQATNNSEQRPLTNAGSCGGFGVDWPAPITTVYPSIGSTTASPSGASAPTPAATATPARVP